MTPVWVAFALGVFLGAPAGWIIVAPLAKRAREAAAQEAYAAGVAAGKLMGRLGERGHERP